MSDLEKKDKPKHKTGLIIIIIFIILTIIELIIFIPKIKESIDKSGVKEIVSTKNDEISSKKNETLTLYYINIEGNPVEYTSTIEREYDLLHDTFEVLIQSPPKEVLEDFNVSYIPSGVKLLGATKSEDAIYIDVSKEILNSTNFNLAYSMLKSTALGFDSEAKFVLLVDGNVYSETISNSTF
jgi:spore germination protein GerM